MEAIPPSESFSINYIFLSRKHGYFIYLKSYLGSGVEKFDSISDIVFSAGKAELEVLDMFGLEPAGHPGKRRLVHHNNWPEGEFPLRKSFHRNKDVPAGNVDVPMNHVQGEGTYEIPVGPVHAGIIEPGHFRFSVAGETVIDLDAQLFFVHKGIEKMAERMDFMKCFYLSERISGDETFANSLAYCMAIEKIADVELPPRALATRLVFAEIERITSHLGDLGGICLDTAYGFGAFQFRMMRGWMYNLADELCGMRFLRSVNFPGGVRLDFLRDKEDYVRGMMDKVEKELKETITMMRKSTFFIDRIESTGILKKGIALDLCATGPAARASGVSYDMRASFDGLGYNLLGFRPSVQEMGDVSSRMNVKLDECLESIRLIRAQLFSLESVADADIRVEIKELPKGKSAVGYAESARGETIHFVRTCDKSRIGRYKVKTASYSNWTALTHAVKGNVVPDFPLINKSFNLSYAGNDL